MFQSFFNLQITPANYSKLPGRLQDYAERLMQIGEHVRIIVQPTQDGFGHAVYCASEAVGEEAFLLMLGDHLYHSGEARSCARQLLDAYHENGTSLLGLHHTPEAQVTSFGTVAGAWIEPGRLLQVTEFTEKPSVEYARQNLRVPGLDEDQYLTVFGQYVLGPELFDILAENIEHNMRERGEFQLTSALERMRREVGFLGLVVNGEAYDIGQPARYLNTLRTFSPGVTRE
jgi:UTP--glucose-1-phosphate uridylyltransferase